jgi:hypothetical protein
MIPQDWFVGGITVLLGAALVTAAVGNLEWYFQLRKMNRLDERLGRRGARVTTFAVGLVLILLGGAIALSMTPRFSGSQPPTANP